MRSRKFLISFFLFLFTQSLFCQNLVPNPSFECGLPPCEGTVIIENFPQYACNWNCPSTGTSDIFGTDVKDKFCYAAMPYNSGYPHSYTGSQLPRTGKRFTGIFIYSGDLPPPHSVYREYLQVELTEPLVPGEYYCAEMYASLAELAHFAANNLAMAFVDEKVNVSNFHELPFTPQVIENEIIVDTANWVKIGGTFKANSPAKYLIIGNFSNDEKTSFVVSYLDNWLYHAYYFIDDISVERVPYPNFTFTGSTSICEGDSINISASVGTSYIHWTTLSDTTTIINVGPQLKVKPNTSTSYYVKAEGCNTIVKDTIDIKVNPVPHVYLGKDTTICAGTSIKLDAGAGHTSNIWQDNSNNRYFNVSEAGKYSVLVKNDFDCSDTDDINISLLQLPKANLGSDTLICENFFPLKGKEQNDEVDYKWSTGSSDSSILPSESGKYWVTLQNRCGVSTDSIIIYSMENLFIPNILTLNNDRYNETFKFKGIGELEWPCSLKIFNRWGKQIYVNHDYKQDWPVSNDLPDDGVYYYTLKFSTCSEYKGWIKVMR